MPSNVPVLNDDILLEVMSASAIADCARFMRTSRFFYDHGPLFLLTRNTPRLTTEPDLLRFLDFLHHEPTRRYQLLRRLELSFIARLSNTSLFQLIDALPRFTHLQYLSIDDADPFLGFLYESLPPAFATLTSLRELRMACVSYTSIDLLHNLRSELVRLHLDFAQPDALDTTFDVDIQQDKWPNFHPVPLLARWTASLEELHSDYWYTHPSITPPADSDVVYPHMRALTLTHTTRCPFTMPYVRAYPNLERLAVSSLPSRVSSWLNAEEAAEDAQEHAARRLLNIEQQRSTAGSTWPHLRTFDGALVDLYVLGLQCSLERVALTALDANHGYMLGPALADVRPRRLELRQWSVYVGMDAVSAVLREEGAGRLEELLIEAELEVQYAYADVARTLDNFLEALGQSCVRDLTLCILLKRSRDDVQDPQLGRTEKLEWGIAVQDYVRRLAEAVPTIQRAVVSVQNVDGRRIREATLADGRV
ncbi:uncharacterized protein TRAVEDRAFT_74910 [Trametes versicolor FP-101664 SS1]|uniref:uncharacterized protein n=1 Tax=Trametes versicolor (strain FP-101664) TaxID=717944 RepID=UPI0004623FB3|nr:uncharacterized protein TRAVEDRAFT_74910 [Trametes versicolor FP-101664 SS1]EIW53774.1 hypothetical protein TRAVEDRAFT_74910 [Trametes versicolor FP-101664 SS1]